MTTQTTHTTQSPDSKVITIFRSRLNEDQREIYKSLAPEIYALARSMPGFLSAKTFSAEDGERVTLVEFDNMENHRAWSNHPRHVEVKKRGIAEFYAEYHIQVCTALYERNFVRKS